MLFFDIFRFDFGKVRQLVPLALVNAGGEILEGGFFFREREKFEDLGSGPWFFTVFKFAAGDADKFFIYLFSLISPCGMDVGQDHGDLLVGEGGLLWRHFQVIALAVDLDGAVETF